MKKDVIFKSIKDAAYKAGVGCYPLVTFDRYVFKLCANGQYIAIPYRRVVDITFSKGCVSINLTQGALVKVFSRFNLVEF